ncbi:hypothetical protein GCM10022268_02380 [Sphingomonas cynarae]|uniref:Uncharacterized protein n=1 Tax=Sphingomonas cynarae TaxID=930197 RepID=A0ABP7CRJ8_9SPHN
MAAVPAAGDRGVSAVERIAERAMARVRARLIAALPVTERGDDLVLQGPRSVLRWPAGALR